MINTNLVNIEDDERDEIVEALLQQAKQFLMGNFLEAHMGNETLDNVMFEQILQENETMKNVVKIMVQKSAFYVDWNKCLAKVAMEMEKNDQVQFIVVDQSDVKH